MKIMKQDIFMEIVEIMKILIVENVQIIGIFQISNLIKIVNSK